MRCGIDLNACSIFLKDDFTTTCGSTHYGYERVEAYMQLGFWADYSGIIIYEHHECKSDGSCLGCAANLTADFVLDENCNIKLTKYFNASSDIYSDCSDISDEELLNEAQCAFGNIALNSSGSPLTYGCGGPNSVSVNGHCLTGGSDCR